ncbi:MAG: hypothetical protein WCW02_01035 [Candidatus Buchananbacteria bacterium]
MAAVRIVVKGPTGTVSLLQVCKERGELEIVTVRPAESCAIFLEKDEGGMTCIFGDANLAKEITS